MQGGFFFPQENVQSGMQILLFVYSVLTQCCPYLQIFQKSWMEENALGFSPVALSSFYFF